MRPEQLVVVDSPGSTASHIEAQVSRIEITGSDALVSARCGDADLTARVSLATASGLDIGTTVTFEVRGGRLFDPETGAALEQPG